MNTSPTTPMNDPNAKNEAANVGPTVCASAAKDWAKRARCLLSADEILLTLLCGIFCEVYCWIML